MTNSHFKQGPSTTTTTHETPRTTTIESISYQDLQTQSQTARIAAKNAFCKRSSYGALAIRGIPQWNQRRSAVMRAGAALAFDSPWRESCASEDEKRVAPGWSGRPGGESHAIQSGFYANLQNEGEGKDGGEMEVDVEVWGENRWPVPNHRDDDGVSERVDFRSSVVNAGQTMHEIVLQTLELAEKAMQEEMTSRIHINTNNNNNNSSSSSSPKPKLPKLRSMAEQSTFLPARLVYYDAKHVRQDSILGGEENYWLPWHVDFNLATAFAPAMWIDEEAALSGSANPQLLSNTVSNPEHRSGLLLRNAEGKVIPAALEEDCILVQLGAHAQIVSGGILRAGPHAVGKDIYDDNGDGSNHSGETDKGVNSAITSNMGRFSFGLFVYGPWDSKMEPPPEFQEENSVLEDDFGGLMQKAYTGETVLAGFRKFEQYMNQM